MVLPGCSECGGYPVTEIVGPGATVTTGLICRECPGMVAVCSPACAAVHDQRLHPPGPKPPMPERMAEVIVDSPRTGHPIRGIVTALPDEKHPDTFRIAMDIPPHGEVWDINISGWGTSIRPR